jgi:hypothetical protein
VKSIQQERQNLTRKAPIDLQKADLQETDLPEASFRETDILEANPEELIRRRAYELYEQRGMQNGFEVEDWLQAEAEVLENQQLPNPRFQKAA